MVMMSIININGNRRVIIAFVYKRLKIEGSLLS
jgi:hypothetical protein